jgi:hypothetical protein
MEGREEEDENTLQMVHSHFVAWRSTGMERAQAEEAEQRS